MSTTTSEPGIADKKPPVALAWVRRNPVALKELRGRMRGARAFVVLMVYVGLMSTFTVLLYMIYATTSQVSVGSSGGVIGKIIFGGVVVVELFLVCFIAPAFTASAISGERERRTLGLLRTTLLPARRLVMGKLISALAYVVLLLVVAIPLQSLAFLMGGVTIEEVLLSFELLIVAAIGYGTLGIFLSALTKRTLSASVLTYALTLVATVALPLVSLTLVGIFGLMFYSPGAGSPVLEALQFYVALLLSATNPIGAAVQTEAVLLQQGSVFLYTETLSNGMGIPLISPWIPYTVLYTLVSLGLILWTVRLVRRADV